MLLKTQNLQLTYENGTIRWIKAGNLEIIRMIYPAVRDRNWGTILPEIENEKIESGDQSFSIKYKAIYKEGDIHFEADYTIQGKGDTVTFKLDGVAKRSFLKNRIGLCILHPINECAGKSFEVEMPNGQKSKHIFPEQISPHQPAKNIQGMGWSVDGISASLKFEGDIFEMEDQRNWTDASYKTYSTPLDIPFPAKIKKGETISQIVTLKVKGKSISGTNDDKIKIEFLGECKPIPNLGFSQSLQAERLPHHDMGLIKQLMPNHYRGDIYFSEKGWKEKCYILHEEAKKLESALFLVLHFSNKFEKELEDLKTCISINGFYPTYLLFIDNDSMCTSSALIKKASELKNEFPKIKVGGGVDANFAELNRSGLDISELDFVSFAITPQVHAFDDMSLIENLEGQKYTIESAKKLFPGKPVFISPITLRQRFNVVATGEEPKQKRGEFPSNIDIRQSSLFNALWTLMSIKYVVESEAGLATYFETTGDRGIIQGYRKPVSSRLKSFPNKIFPVFHIFEMIRDAREILKTQSSHPLFVDSVCFQFEDFVAMFVVNFSHERKTVQLPENFKDCKRVEVGKGFELSESKTKKMTQELNPGSLTIFET